MQRVRMSLPYFKEFGWEAEVVSVDEQYTDIVKDNLLSLSVPLNITIHKVGALSKRWTSKLGLGSLALRSLLYYKKKVNQLLLNHKFDLIYFSTTQFPVCILGAYWKKKYKVPYVIDMQDPWHSDYYKDKPKEEQPAKYWFSYRLNKFLEPIAMRKVGGLISVSDAYIKVLKERYKECELIPNATITFGAFAKDFEILTNNEMAIPATIASDKEIYSLVYVGRGGYDMEDALSLLFGAFRKGLQDKPALFEKFRFYFIGTSYAPPGMGKQTIKPVAEKFGLQDYVFEQTDRVPFYQGLKTLQDADGLIVPGSNDPAYTASKLYPYILAKKPLVGIFNSASSAGKILRECNAGDVINLETSKGEAYNTIKNFFYKISTCSWKENTNWKNFEPYTAKEMCRKQVLLFNQVLNEIDY